MTQWTWGWNLSFWLQVCSTLKKPISAPRCLGSRATSRSVSALVRNKRSRSEEHTSELQSHLNLVCRLLLEKKKSRYRPHSSPFALRHTAPPISHHRPPI